MRLRAKKDSLGEDELLECMGGFFCTRGCSRHWRMGQWFFRPPLPPQAFWLPMARSLTLTVIPLRRFSPACPPAPPQSGGGGVTA